jgi:hypothetical protein
VQWLKNFFDANCRDERYNALAERGGQAMGSGIGKRVRQTQPVTPTIPKFQRTPNAATNGKQAVLPWRGAGSIGEFESEVRNSCRNGFIFCVICVACIICVYIILYSLSLSTGSSSKLVDCRYSRSTVCTVSPLC